MKIGVRPDDQTKLYEEISKLTGWEREQTNKEWIQSATTEQLAEWLRGVYWHCHEIDCEHCKYPWRCMEKGDIVEWLKQPHQGGE